jgi:hypothetical protein
MSMPGKYPARTKKENSMTTRILRAPPVAGMVALKLQTAYQRFLGALDTFVEAKVRNAVPEYELRRAQREINRYRRLMHANHRLPETRAPAGH